MAKVFICVSISFFSISLVSKQLDVILPSVETHTLLQVVWPMHAIIAHATLWPRLACTYRCVIFFVYLDGLICLSCEQATATHVKQTLEYSSLTVQGPRLHCSLQLLEVVASFPVPEHETAIITCRRGREGGRERYGAGYNTQCAAIAPRPSTTHPLVWAEQHKHTSVYNLPVPGLPP